MYLSFIVSPYPSTFVLCTLVSLIRSLVFRYLYSVSIRVYTLLNTPINSVLSIQFYPYFYPILRI